jgi:hypothetical protein
MQTTTIEVGSDEGKDENAYCVKDNGIGFDMIYHENSSPSSRG